MARQIAVKLIRNLVQLPQPSPRHGREVVVLVVQADVVREQVQHAIVRESLRWRRQLRFLALLVGFLQRARVLCKDVVLGDEVACDGVQGAGEEGAQDEVAESFAADVLHEEVVDGELHEDVESVDARQGQVVDHHGAQGVEEDLEGCEEGFAGDGVEEPGFEGGGEVGVQAVYAERLVVCEMVGLDLDVRPCVRGRSAQVDVPTYPERSRVRNANRQISENRQHAVRKRRLKSQIMRDLMNSQEKVLVRRRANDVSSHECLPRQERRVAQRISAEELQANNAEHDRDGQDLGAAEFEDL
jgi:hypothetical protein